jgi:hypothetical protein
MSFPDRKILLFGFAGLFLAICLSLFVATHTVKASAGYIVNFGGYLVDVDYATCDCGFVIFTVYDKSTHMQYKAIWFYVAQLLEDLGVKWEIAGMPIPIPRIYADYAIWPGSDANVVGNFFPYEDASCLVITSTGCATVNGAGDGYLINMGTSMKGSN